MSKQKKYLGMGLKPLPLLYFLNPFTKVNGNNGNKFKWNTFSLPYAKAVGNELNKFKRSAFLLPSALAVDNESRQFEWSAFSLPSALADGLSKLLLIWALATLRFE